MKTLVVFVALLPVIAAGEECATIDPETSYVQFEIEQAGSPFSGRFDGVQGEVCREDGNIARLRAQVSPDSVATGLPELDAVLKDELFFDVERYPEIQFTSEHVVRNGDEWLADGELTIKGKTRPVQLPFAVTEISDTSQATGEIEIRRLDFAIGTGEWENTAWLSNAVHVYFLVQEDVTQD